MNVDTLRKLNGAILYTLSCYYMWDAWDLGPKRVHSVLLISYMILNWMTLFNPYYKVF